MKRLGQALIGAVAAALSIGAPSASAQPTTPSATPTSVVVGDDVRQHLVSEYQQRLRALTSPGRILGGTLAAATDFPWQVALVSAGYSPRDGQYCGGTLVAPTWVLTAAHCVSVGTQPSDLTVYAGSTSLAGGGTTVNVVQIFPHERFNAKTFDNDVALLLLDSPLDPTWSINLLSAGEETMSAAPGRKGRVSGWGLTVEGGSP
jgi:secreted trypsin-like serine protease